MSLFSAPSRDFKPELLDLDEASFEEVRDSLGDVRRVNRNLSGYRVLLFHAECFMRDHKERRPFSVVDLATGSCDQPVELVILARRLGIPIRVVAIDINRKMLSYAREEIREFPEIELVQCDILSLPFRDKSFDLAVNNLSLHHFSWEGAVGIIRTLNRLGRKGFIINDLRRSRVAYVSILFLTRLLTRNRLTRYDAPVSVMNAFVPDELHSLAIEAEIEVFEIFRHFPYRLALVGYKGRLT